jgi:putative ABC transport system permease protein
MHTPLGYDPHNVMSVGIPIHDGTYKTWAERAPYFEQLRIAAAGVPGVKMAAISSNATPPSNGFNTKFEMIGKAGRAGSAIPVEYGEPGVFHGVAHPAGPRADLGPG